MPILDAVVLFGAVDPKDAVHDNSKRFLARLAGPGYYLAGFAMLEFDIVMKSRGFSHGQRMLQDALLARDYPDSTVKVGPVSPTVLYLSAKIEGEEDSRIEQVDTIPLVSAAQIAVGAGTSPA